MLVALVRAGYGQDRGALAALSFVSTELAAARMRGQYETADAVLVVMWALRRADRRPTGTAWFLVRPGDLSFLTGEPLREWLRRWARDTSDSAVAAADKETALLGRVARAAAEIGPASPACIVLRGPRPRAWPDPCAGKSA